jgi:hypothetical protein
MKKNWLRGLLLGMCLALLLAGGVASAGSLRIWANKDCVVCTPGYMFRGSEPSDPAETYKVLVGFAGWNPLHAVCAALFIDDEPVGPPECTDPPAEEPDTYETRIPCRYYEDQEVLGLDVTADNATPGPLGLWTWRVYQEDPPGTVIDSAEVSFLVVKDISECALEADFVPEPGSILLLGSGLAGLAGYATLRWRPRE